MGWLIRRASATDLDALVPLVAACFEPAWSRAAIDGALRAREARGLVAEGGVGGADRATPLLGCVLARRILDVLEIDLVGVAPTARRCGLAARMLTTLIDAEQQAGASSAQLELSSDNAAAAALYARLGFVVVGRRPRYYPGGHDALLLSRSLG